MLILTRRIGETLMVDDNGKLTEVTVLGVKGNQVRLGITAEKNVAVDREEIYRSKQAQRNNVATMTDERQRLVAG
ncbi:carbon storage regulator CsrA [Zhongshania borealis]|uniref:Translational regulator CsrA n=1 Tax=Zhongshania borealis TaxID=889488 RepID=A0ABP7WEA9_9GAMM